VVVGGGAGKVVVVGLGGSVVVVGLVGNVVVVGVIGNVVVVGPEQPEVSLQTRFDEGSASKSQNELATVTPSLRTQI
jgi:hypothetical protein